MRFAKWSFFVVFISVSLSIFTTGCVQIVSAQTYSGADVYRTPITSSIVEDSAPASSSAAVSSKSSVSSSSVLSQIPTATPSPEAVSSVPESSQPAIETTGAAASTVTTPYKTTAAVPTLAPTKAPTAAPTKAPVAAPKPAVSTAIVLDNLIGQTTAQITAIFGQPNDKQLSEYGFTWYIYNSNYKRFIMIGISNGTVVGVYSNSSALNFHGLTVGTARASVRSVLAAAAFGTPLTSITKGNARYTISNADQKDTFNNGTTFTTVFYDNIEGGILTSIQIIEKSTEMSIGYYGTPSAVLASSFEKTSFYLINAIRARKGIALLTWDAKMAGMAKAHSTDMCVNNYFSHTNLAGLNSSARFKAAGISYSDCAENIAKNHASAITAHESYMNSAGHRKNILRLCKNVGVGVSMGNGAILLTQDFITYR